MFDKIITENKSRLKTGSRKEKVLFLHNKRLPLRVSVGGAAVVGDVLQAAHQSRVAVGTDPFGRGLVFQGHAALPGWSFPSADHAVDLVESLRGQTSQVTALQTGSDQPNRFCMKTPVFQTHQSELHMLTKSIISVIQQKI